MRLHNCSVYGESSRTHKRAIMCDRNAYKDTYTMFSGPAAGEKIYRGKGTPPGGWGVKAKSYVNKDI